MNTQTEAGYRAAAASGARNPTREPNTLPITARRCLWTAALSAALALPLPAASSGDVRLMHVGGAAGRSGASPDDSFSVAPGQEIRLSGWTVVNEASCSLVDIGSWTLNSSPQWGSVSYGTDNFPLADGACPGYTFPYATIYYTANSNAPNTTDSFAGTWYSPYSSPQTEQETFDVTITATSPPPPPPPPPLPPPETPPDPSIQLSMGCNIQCFMGDPINIAAGNLYESETDFTSSIGTLPLTIVRTYNSLNTKAGIFGTGWSSNLDSHLYSNSKGTSVYAVLPDGKQLQFDKSGTNWVAHTGVPVTMSNGGGTNFFVRMMATGDVYTFRANGQLAYQQNLYGEQLAFHYNSNGQLANITDNYGNELQIGHGNNTITISVMGLTYTYGQGTVAGHGNAIQLLTVTYQMDGTPVTRHYTYGSAFGLTQETLSGGVTPSAAVSNWNYDTSGHANYSGHALIQGPGALDSMTVDYSHLTGATPYVTSTNANGHQTRYYIASNADSSSYIERTWNIISGNSNVPPSNTYTADNSQDQPAIVVDANGYATENTYDAATGVLIQQVKGYQWNGGSLPVTAAELSSTTTMTKMHVTALNPSFPEPTQIIYSATNANGGWFQTKQVDAQYDQNSGRLTQWKETDLTNYTDPYPTSGQTRTWNYVYTYFDSPANTKVSSEFIYDPRAGFNGTTGSLAYCTRLDFDQDGHLIGKTLPNGETKYATFNPRGKPQMILDPNDNQTSITYNEKDEPEVITTGYGTAQTVTERISYYADGRVYQTTQGDGSYLRFAYDGAGDVIEIDDDAGNRQVFTPNPLDGQWTQRTVYNNEGKPLELDQRAFDDIGRLLTITNADGSNRLTNTWDPASNLLTTFRGGDTSTKLSMTYDALERLQQSNHAPTTGGSLAPYIINTYDQSTAVSRVTDARGLNTNYFRDGFGNIMKVQTADSGTTRYWHDSVGNVIQKQDAKGQTLLYTVDGLNRVTSIVDGSTNQQIEGFWYDTNPMQGPRRKRSAGPHSSLYPQNWVGHLVQISEASGDSTVFSYDPQGHVVEKDQYTAGQLLKTKYSFVPGTTDLATMTLPSGNVIGYTWTHGHITSMTYQKAGTTTQPVVVSNVTYQPFGGPLSWTFKNGETMGRSYDMDGAISSDPVDSQIDYYPDKVSIKDMTLGGSGAFYTGTRNFGYDNFDHVTSLTGTVVPGTGSAQQLSYGYTWDSDDNRLTQTVAGVTTTYGIGTGNNRTINSVVGGVTTKYSFDTDGSYQGNSSTSPAESYDAMERLVSYNGATPASYTLNGRNERVAKTAGGVTTLFAYDEAGRIIGEYNPDGSIIEETVYLGDMPVLTLFPSAYFYIRADYRNAPRQVDTGSATIRWAWDPLAFGDNLPNKNPTGLGNFNYNLRYPGQYYDAESGNFYNYHRNYNPALGRYLEADPMGQAAGINVYGYVGGNPLGATDPRGEDPVMALAGALIGGGWGLVNGLVSGDKGMALLEDTGAGAGTGFLAGLTDGVSLLEGASGYAVRTVVASGIEAFRQNINSGSENYIEVAAAGMLSLGGDFAGNIAGEDFGYLVSNNFGGIMALPFSWLDRQKDLMHEEWQDIQREWQESQAEGQSSESQTQVSATQCP